MFSEAKVTEIYCMADDFCKEFTLQQKKYMIEDKGHKHRNKPNRMNDAEVMVILILFHSGGFRCFKHYYRHINRLTGNADILQLAFLTESANMNHGCGTYHPRDALKVGTLHNLMIAEILF